jgi:uncharacterized repeat protein (TIGR01451 family)
MKKMCVLLLLTMTYSAVAIKGKDGDLTVVGNQQVNYFSGLTAVNTVGGITLTVSNINDLNDVAGIYASAAVSPGDLIMLYQAQGATFADNGNTNTYGAFNVGNAGRYEVYEVISVSGNDLVVAENGTLCNGNSLIYSYDLGLTQVIRIPQFNNLTINAGGSITTTAWNGSRGGVIAIDVNTNLVVNGTITAASAGFRGGAIDNVTTAAGTDVALYRGTSNANGAEKGESILGFATVYDANNGRYGRGAAANGGGGGNAHNGGGGGGANGDNGVPWNGQGNPDNGPANWTTAWNLDPTLNAATTSSGGGRGGYTYGSSNQDAITVAPGNAAWGGNSRRERGGLGGRPVPFDDVGRLFFGGGGGAGDGNNSQAGAGGRGGGLVYLITNNLTGSGSINVNGQAGSNTGGGGNNDAPGGGGAGGTIVISANSTAATINLTANGGVGGNQLPITNENEGPGGGGGGGVISVSGGTGISTTNGGVNGISQSTAVTEFLANGATIGAQGQPNEVTAPVSNLPICRAINSLGTNKVLTSNADEDGSLSVTEGDTLTFTITVTNTGDFPLNNMTASDPQLTPNVNNCGTVAPGGTCVLVGNYVVTNADVLAGTFTNTGTGDSDETAPVDDVVMTPVFGSPSISTGKALTNNADEDASGTVTEGDTLTFTITVTNTGNIPLNNMTASDPQLTPNVNNCGTVAPGGTCVLVGTYVVTNADVLAGTFTNTGTGDSDETAPIDDVVMTPVFGSPSISTGKALTNNADEDASGTVTEGDTLTFTITVTNTGNIPLNNLTASDSQLTPNVNNCGTVAPGGTCVLVGTYVVTNADVLAGTFTNTGTGDSDETAPVNDVVMTPVLGSPAMVVTKMATLTIDNGTPNSADAGDEITFAVSVQNTGNVTLTSLVVTDPMGGGTLTCAPTTLAPGQISTCNSYTYTVTQADVDNGGTIDNTASATAQDPNNNPVTDDDSTSTPITAGGPSLITAKSLTNHNDVDLDGNITVGDILTFTIIATNNGNVTLNNVVVSDPMITPNSNTCPTVAPGATCQLVGTYTVQQSDVDNGQVENTGTGDSDETPPDPDTVVTPVPQSPAITVTKTATLTIDNGTPNSADAGDEITFAVSVQNTGNVTLTGLVVTDPMGGGTLTCTPTTLAPNQIATCNAYTYTVTQADVDNGGTIDNTASATAQDPNNNPVSDDGSTSTPITVGGPSLITAKSMTNHNDVDGDGNITVGDILTYSIVVTNNGSITLNNVVVTDTIINPSSNTCPTVAPGDTCVLTGDYTVQQSDVDNGQIINTGTGDSDETPPVDDTHTIDLSPIPALDTEKSLTGNADEDNSGTVTIGDTLTFTIHVTNTGNMTLTQVTVTDNMITPGSTVCPVLLVGEVCTLVGTYVVTQQDVNNGRIVNIAEGESIETGPDPDTDTETVIVSGPAPEIRPVPSSNLITLMLLMLSLGYLARRRLN